MSTDTQTVVARGNYDRVIIKVHKIEDEDEIVDIGMIVDFGREEIKSIFFSRQEAMLLFNVLRSFLELEIDFKETPRTT